jgi:DNA-binding CsgD family transcriptional regulator
MASNVVQGEIPVELTENECLVFEHLLAHKKAKQVARELGLSPSAVEERIRSVRQKLGAPDRTVAVQLYAAGRHQHRNAVSRFQGVEPAPFSDEELARELDGGPVYSLRDSQAWGGWRNRPTLLETIDERFGMLGRVGLIFACFLIVCLALGSVSNFFEAMNKVM